MAIYNCIILSCVFMNKEEHVYIKIYLSFCSQRGPQFVVSLRDRWRDIYSERGLLVPYLLLGARGCQHLHHLESYIIRDNLAPLISCMSLARLSILWPLSKSNPVVLISHGLLPVTYLLDLTAPTCCHPPVY